MSIKLTVAIALAILGLYLLQGGEPVVLLSDGWCLVFGDVEGEIEQIERQYGITIKHDVGDQAIPELWRNPPANGAAEPITRYNLCHYFTIFSRELKMYPEDVIRRDLSTVYLLSQLSFYGVQYGGTSLGSAVYLTGDAGSEGYTDDYFAKLFHHEMSSLFFNAYRFPKEDWSSINSHEFCYAEADRQVLRAIANGDELDGNANLYREGFLSAYGHSTLENDFNLFAEMAFMEPRQLRELSKQYPRIRRKASLLKKFYRGISKDFSMDF